MISRIVKLPETNSFFLFGPRGTGKSTLLSELFGPEKALWIDLLKPEDEQRLFRNPGGLANQVSALSPEITWVVIDEIQKLPSLLDVVHHLIESKGIRFALTGSSARKLRRGGANLLAGRAFVRHLFPLTHVELQNQFNLTTALHWGTLPKVLSFARDEDRADFLRTYAQTYLKEEIVAEQTVRELDPFRRFLEIAAQCNGEIVNFSKIARQVGCDPKTVQSYFQILEDTMIGFLLEPYHESIRKRQTQAPKFYLFDPGVKRALERTLEVPLLSHTYAYGKAFEHFMICEIARLCAYRKPDYKLSYLRTKDQAEIDLIIERPGMPLALIEIKSNDQIRNEHVAGFNTLAKSFKSAQAICLCQEIRPQVIDQVHVLPWQQGITELGCQF